MGTVRVGRTDHLTVSQLLEACSIAMMIFLLLGGHRHGLGGHALDGGKDVSVAGFMVWPPETTASAVRSVNTAFRPSPATATRRSHGWGPLRRKQSLACAEPFQRWPAFSRLLPASGGPGTALVIFSILEVGQVAAVLDGLAQDLTGVSGVDVQVDDMSSSSMRTTSPLDSARRASLRLAPRTC